MKRVDQDEMWSLFCPSDCRDLPTTYGETFEKLYLEYESKGVYRQQIKARTIWFAILDAQMETGNPYMLYKDAANIKSNHNHMGTISCSNLVQKL